MAKTSYLTNHVSEPYRSLREDIYYSQYGVTKVPIQPKSPSDKTKKKRQVNNIVLLFVIFIFQQSKKLIQGKL